MRDRRDENARSAGACPVEGAEQSEGRRPRGFMPRGASVGCCERRESRRAHQHCGNYSH
ncbi:MAG: hypothetical protein P8123_01235 [bacterium]